MKAAVCTGKEKIEIKEIEKPILKDKGAIVKVLGCGLCGSDIIKYKQTIESLVLGHEIIAEIIEINSDNNVLKVGDIIAGGHHIPCYTCKYCKGDSYSMCEQFKNTNIIPGGFCQYVYLSELHLQNTFFKISNKITHEKASFTEPLSCCLRAVKRANIQKDDEVLIIGLGTIGLLMGQTAKHFGAKISGIDIVEERCLIAKELGFDNIYKSEENIENIYKNKTSNIGADKVFLCSGNALTIDLALKCVRDGGTIVVFASIPSYEKGFANNDIYYRELTVMGSYSPSPQDIKESLNLLENDIIKVDNLTTIYTLEDVHNAIKDTLSGKIMKAYIKIS